MRFPPKLDRRLDLEERALISDGAGGFEPTWTKLGTLPASVVPRTGREVEIGSKQVSQNSFKVLLRAAPDNSPARPKPDQRFREGTRIYGILGVSESAKSDLYLECWVKEGIDE